MRHGKNTIMGALMERKIHTAAVTGCGRIGFTLGFDRKREQPASHTMALLGNRSVRLVAGCDTDRARLEEWREYVSGRTGDVNTYTDAGRMMSAEKPEIAVIAVNENAHLETALNIISYTPRLVILEKPVALNMEQGLEIKTQAEKFGVAVAVNHERRFADDYRAARNFMPEIGDVISVAARLDSGMAVYRKSEAATGAYSLLHDGTHLVDAVQFLLGDKIHTESVRITAAEYVDGGNSVRTMRMQCSCDRCADISIAMSGKSRWFGFEIDITGTTGRVRIGNGIFGLYRRAESPFYTGFWSLLPDKSSKPPKRTGYFSNMVSNAVDFLDGRGGLLSTLDTGLDTLRVLEHTGNLLSAGRVD